VCFSFWNQFAPLVDPAPGIYLTTTVGLPGNASLKSGAKKLAHFADPPVSENGIVHSTVLPVMSTSWWAAAKAPVDIPTAATDAQMPAEIFLVSMKTRSYFYSYIYFEDANHIWTF
jgi:hypothetical protein